MPQKFLFGTLANTRHDANGQREKEIELGTWVNYGKTTWFILVRSNFCNRFARSDPNRARNAKMSHSLLDSVSDGNRMLRVDFGRGDIDESLIDAYLLHMGAFIVQNSHDSSRHFLVAVKMTMRPYRLGTELARSRSGHCGMNPIGTSLITRR